MDAVHIVVLGVSSLAPVAVAVACLINIRDYFYREFRHSMRADRRSPWGW